MILDSWCLILYLVYLLFHRFTKYICQHLHFDSLVSNISFLKEKLLGNGIGLKIYIGLGVINTGSTYFCDYLFNCFWEYEFESDRRIWSKHV